MTATQAIHHAQALTLNAKVREVKALYSEIVEEEKLIFAKKFGLMVRYWKMGRRLCEMKEEVGHGKWLFWLGGHLPELGERTAQRSMAFFKANEHWKLIKSDKFGGFEIESVRKMQWVDIPPKERPALEGDSKDSPESHHLTCVNNFFKWDRQVQIGQINLPPPEILRHELEQMVRRIAEICGGDWVRSLLS